MANTASWCTSLPRQLNVTPVRRLAARTARGRNSPHQSSGPLTVILGGYCLEGKSRDTCTQSLSCDGHTHRPPDAYRQSEPMAAALQLMPYEAHMIANYPAESSMSRIVQATSKRGQIENRLPHQRRVTLRMFPHRLVGRCNVV